MRRRVHYIHALARLVVAAVVAASCRKGDEAGADSATARPTVGAKTIIVTAQAFTETFGAIGTVTPRANHVATLMAPAAGRVGTVNVTTGQSVQAGEVLVELDQAPFQAALQATVVALDAAQRASDRKQRLAQEGIIARSEAEAAASELAKAKADEVAARRVEQLSILHSPIAGVVTRMTATLGASVDPAQPLVEISDPHMLDVLLNVTPTDAARVHVGAKVALSAGQTASGEPLGIGSVADISGTVDSTNRSVAVRVQAPSTKRPLRIGETVFGSITVATRPAAIVVPAEALVPEGDGFKVFVVDANNIAHDRDVKVGTKTNTTVEIIDGLKAGERVVTYGAYGMRDSSKVVPPTTTGDSAKSETPDKDETPAKPGAAVKAVPPAKPEKP